MNNKKVSIIMPIHNRREFVLKAIMSVKKQTFENWELIAIDDCSTDGSLQLVEKVALKDKRIKIIKHKTNWGIRRLKDTYNEALKISRGNVIAILEDDDFWPKDKLEIQIKDFNEDIVMSFGDCVIVNQEGVPFTILDYSSKVSRLNKSAKGEELSEFLDIVGYLVPVSVLFLKKALLYCDGFVSDKNYPFPDIPTFLALSARGSFSYNHNILGYYRKHSASNWYNFASKTNAMLRSELELSFKKFIKDNSRMLIKAGHHPGAKFDNKREKFILRKVKNRQSSILIHEFLFLNKQETRERAMNIINSGKERILNKAQAGIFYIGTFVGVTSHIFFQIQYFMYKITSKLKKGKHLLSLTHSKIVVE